MEKLSAYLVHQLLTNRGVNGGVNTPLFRAIAESSLYLNISKIGLSPNLHHL